MKRTHQGMLHLISLPTQTHTLTHEIYFVEVASHYLHILQQICGELELKEMLTADLTDI